MEIAAYRQPSVLKRKRALAGCEAFDIKKEAAFAVDNMPNTERMREIVRQRFQAELVVVRRLLEKAAAVPRPEEAPAKRSKKASTATPVVARKMKPEEEEEEDVDIVGGVSPLAIPPAPLLLAEDEDEDVDICGDASPVVIPKNLCDDATISASPSSSSSSSSDSDSDSGSCSSSSSSSSSDSDEDESVDSQESLAERDATLLIARAKESLARCRAREKARQEVLETERTAMPSDTIHPTVLQSLRIDEHDTYSLLRRLGLFLKADNYGIKEQQHHHRHIFQEELEEGEIRL